jgi:hypothetical protein
MCVQLLYNLITESFVTARVGDIAGKSIKEWRAFHKQSAPG